MQGNRGKNGNGQMKNKWKIFVIVLLSVVFCDQLSKLLISKFMHPGQSIKVLGFFFHLTYVKNPDAAFGIPMGSPYLMMILTSIATVLLLIYFSRLKGQGKLFYSGLVLIIGGAIGNLIDRFRMKEVIDFIEIGLRRLKWPVFNIADSCVTIGIIIIIWVWFFEKKEKPEERNTKLTNEKNML